MKRIITIILLLLLTLNVKAYRAYRYRLIGLTFGYEFVNNMYSIQIDYTKFGSACASRSFYKSFGLNYKMNNYFSELGINYFLEPIQIVNRDLRTPFVIGLEPSIVFDNNNINKIKPAITPSIGVKYYFKNIFTRWDKSEHLSPVNIKIEMLYAYRILGETDFVNNLGHQISIRIGIGLNMRKQNQDY